MNQNIITGTRYNYLRKTKKIIKRYGNRKLYDTEQSSYVVLKDIAKMICKEQDILIVDNKTRRDITSDTLTQIICGAERSTNQSVPISLLKTIIKNGDGSFSSFLTSPGLLFGGHITDKKITIKEGRQRGQRVTKKVSSRSAKGRYKTTTKGGDYLQHRNVQERVLQALGPNHKNEHITTLPTGNRGNRGNRGKKKQ